MRVEIKKVSECKNKAYGNFLLRGRESAQITISMKLNDTLAEYGATTLHELLHLWTTLLRKEGFRMNNKKEHQWINAAEKIILEAMKQTLKGRK